MATRRLFALSVLLTVLFLIASLVAENTQFSPSEGTFASSKKNVDLVYFYGEGCPHCAKVEPFIRELEQKYEVIIEAYEIYSNRSNMKLMQGYFERYDLPMNRMGVPAVFTSNSYIVGDADILQGLESTLSSSVNSVSTRVERSSSNVSEKCENESLDCFSLLTITAAALVDSINPCSVSILFFLLAGLLLLRNRKKALRIGLMFVLSAFVANLLFGLGISSVIALSGLSSVLRFAAGFIAVLVGGLLIKDYFFYGKGGFAMEVPRSLRPYLKHKLSRAFFGKPSLVGVFLVGLLVTSFEVPCTGGPYLYVLAQMADETTRTQTIPLLLYYNFIFVMPLILITAFLYLGAIHVENAREWSDRNKRLVSLIRGLPMIAIGFMTIPTQGMLQVLAAVLTVYRVVFIPVAAFLLSYIACQAFSRPENKNRALRFARIASLTTILVTAAVYAQTDINDGGFPTSYAQANCVTIISPQNNVAYYKSHVPLNYTVTEPTSWIGYSLDNEPNVTITGNTTLIGLTDGSHDITLFANDTLGNMCATDPVSFFYCLGDVTGSAGASDEKVDIVDLTSVLNLYGAISGDGKYDQRMDVNDDGKIAIKDIYLVARGFGKICMHRNGELCTTSSNCLSGYCVDNYCCDSACSGQCDSCDIPGLLGTCTISPAGSSGNPSCGPYVCNGGSAFCPNSCSTDSQCSANYYCDDNVCVPKLPNGWPCDRDGECISGNCTGGICVP